jgi:hypothetical protein
MCKSNYAVSKQGNMDTQLLIHTSNTPYEDTNEWLAESGELF